MQINTSDDYAVNTYTRVPDIAIKMAVAVIGTVPILCVYPFLQKYFIKGVYVGAVKG
jgi:putative aldouronate transport system permease protein